MGVEFINSTDLRKAVGNASTWSIPTHSSIEGGAAFIVGMNLRSTGIVVSTVTDNAGNVYTKAIAEGSTNFNGRAELWYATNISSASTRISMTLSGNSSGHISVLQLRSVSTGNALGPTGSSEITAVSSQHSAADITPTDTGVVVALCAVNASSLGFWSSVGGNSSDALWSAQPLFNVCGTWRITNVLTTESGYLRSDSQVLHVMVVAAFGDTVAGAPPVGGGMNWTYTMLGVQ